MEILAQPQQASQLEPELGTAQPQLVPIYLHNHEEVCFILSRISPNSSVCFIGYKIVLLYTGEAVKENVIYSFEKINMGEVSQPLAKDLLLEIGLEKNKTQYCQTQSQKWKEQTHAENIIV